VQPVCLLLRPPIKLPDAVGILRAPPSVPTKGLRLVPNPPELQAAPNIIKISFHLSKILLFVKDKNDSREFFFRRRTLASVSCSTDSYRTLAAHFFAAQYTLFFVKCKGKLIPVKKIFTTKLNSLNIVPCVLLLEPPEVK
jgi:hypothetical protein